MTYASGRTFFDADSHVMELPDFLRDHADPELRERMPRIPVPKVGTLANLLEDAKERKAHGPERVAEGERSRPAITQKRQPARSVRQAQRAA